MSLKLYKEHIGEQVRYGYKNEQGEIKIKAQYTFAYEFNEGLALVVTYGSNKLRFINEKGENKILLGGCTQARSFKNGLAMAKFNNRWALINSKGVNLTGFVFKDENLAEISDVNIMTSLIKTNGAKVLNWASLEILKDDKNLRNFKQALDFYLKNIVEEKKILDNKQYEIIANKEYNIYSQICSNKLKKVDSKIL